MNDIISAAIAKLTNELATFKGDRHGEIVKSATAEVLMDFCNKSEEFAAIVANTRKTFSDCIAQTVKGVGNGCSDVEVYRRAVQFYCPGADVKFSVTIELPGKPAPTPNPTPAAEKSARSGKLINIFDIL